MKIHGIPVVYDPSVRTIAQARGVWPFYRIAVGPEWLAGEGEERAAHLLHEVGHCRGHHMLKRLLTAPLIMVWWLGHRCCQIACAVAQRQELEADQFAADHGFGLPLAHALARHEVPDSPFYPSNAIRASILMARHCKESPPC